jgi:hypothetical protein
LIAPWMLPNLPLRRRSGTVASSHSRLRAGVTRDSEEAYCLAASLRLKPAVVEANRPGCARTYWNHRGCRVVLIEPEPSILSVEFSCPTRCLCSTFWQTDPGEELNEMSFSAAR